jgi:glycerol-3-phosphate dehydrogenase
MRGLSVLLIDKGDIGGGTSSWSTRLIHGGLRYLEHFEIGLVRESLREREVLFHIAPHLVKPLPLLIPIYRKSKRGRLLIRLGMLAYDLLSHDKSLPRHQMLSSAETLNLATGLKKEGLVGGANYYDAQVEFAERLVLENVLSARANGASVKTYCRLDRLIIENGKFLGAEIIDLMSNETCVVHGSIAINAAGPWVDEIAGAWSNQKLIGGTKGSHIVVGRFPGAPESALYIEAQADSRPFFVIPWNGNYLIGTTDTRYEGDLDRIRIDESEIEYLLTEVNNLIPAAQLARKSILFAYAGVRPLPFVAKEKERAITRRHFISGHERAQNLFSIIGGKLTTYRSLAEEAVDLVFKTLERRAPGSATKDKPLPGAAGIADFDEIRRQLESNVLVSAKTVDHLLHVYGTRAVAVLKCANDEARLLECFDKETGAIAAEVVFAFQEEMAKTLSDCMLRRTMVGLNSRAGIGADEAAAEIAQRYLGWPEQRVRREVEEYRKRQHFAFATPIV